MVNSQDLYSNSNKVFLRSYQNQISYVSQRSFVEDTTILDNIVSRESEPDASKRFQRAKTAAKVAQISEYIDSLPKGFDTLVGELGVNISGGEIQRICLARAIAQDLPILVMDEATSALNPQLEQAIFENLCALRKKTIIFITHRPELNHFCTKVIKMS